MRYRNCLLTALLIGLSMARSAPAGEMRALKSQHYLIHTDLDKELALEISQRLDAMYEEYARRLVDFPVTNPTAVFDVYIFAKHDDYLKFTDGRFANTGGIFIPARNLLAAFLEGQGRATLYRTLQHEAFHQFAHTAIGPNIPVWLNEGIAQLFEEGLWTGGGFWLGQVTPRRVRQLQADIQNRRLIRFSEFLFYDNEKWGEVLGGDIEHGSTVYNQAWAMSQYLVNATDNAGQPVHRQRLIRYLKLLHDGQPSIDAWNMAFSDNVQGFQDRFVEYARALQATPEASIIERQDTLADLFTLVSANGTTFGDMAGFRDHVIKGGYRLQYTRGSLNWKTQSDPKVYFCDLKGAQYDSNSLFFENRWSAPLPDIVCRCSKQFWLRTRFYRLNNEVEHEVLIEPAKW